MTFRQNFFLQDISLETNLERVRVRVRLGLGLGLGSGLELVFGIGLVLVKPLVCYVLSL